ncbi:hypothetical protein HK104_003342, partial [Borealophlyctis nickersoniae]
MIRDVLAEHEPDKGDETTAPNGMELFGGGLERLLGSGEAEERRKPRKSLGRRVSFAATAHVKLFDKDGWPEMKPEKKSDTVTSSKQPEDEDDFQLSDAASGFGTSDSSNTSQISDNSEATSGHDTSTEHDTSFDIPVKQPAHHLPVLAFPSTAGIAEERKRRRSSIGSDVLADVGQRSADVTSRRRTLGGIPAVADTDQVSFHWKESQKEKAGTPYKAKNTGPDPVQVPTPGFARPRDSIAPFFDNLRDPPPYSPFRSSAAFQSPAESPYAKTSQTVGERRRDSIYPILHEDGEDASVITGNENHLVSVPPGNDDDSDRDYDPVLGDDSMMSIDQPSQSSSMMEDYSTDVTEDEDMAVTNTDIMECINRMAAAEASSSGDGGSVEVNTVAAEVPVQPNVRQNAVQYPQLVMSDENDTIGRFFYDHRKDTAVFMEEANEDSSDDDVPAPRLSSTTMDLTRCMGGIMPSPTDEGLNPSVPLDRGLAEIEMSASPTNTAMQRKLSMTR